jgi:hypothetical protein
MKQTPVEEVDSSNGGVGVRNNRIHFFHQLQIVYIDNYHLHAHKNLARDNGILKLKKERNVEHII